MKRKKIRKGWPVIMWAVCYQDETNYSPKWVPLAGDVYHSRDDALTRCLPGHKVKRISVELL